MPSNNLHNNIRFHYLKPVVFRKKRCIKEVVVRILKSARLEPGDINYVFCSDDYLRVINREHLGHDYYTDIITFDLSDREGVCCADIFISVDRVRENASSFKASIQTELSRVIFHGALHLAGFKDKTPAQQKAMRAQENNALAELAKCFT